MVGLSARRSFSGIFSLDFLFNFFHLYTLSISESKLNPLSTNPTKWSNTLKQFVGNLARNCLSVFGHFVGLAIKGLSLIFSSPCELLSTQTLLADINCNVFREKHDSFFFCFYFYFFIYLLTLVIPTKESISRIYRYFQYLHALFLKYTNTNVY